MTLPGFTVVPQRSCSSDKPLGCEIVLPAHAGTEQVRSALQWAAGEGHASCDGCRFVVLRLPHPLDRSEAGTLAELAQQAGLTNRLCLGVPSVEGPWADTASALQASALMVMLDDVGMHTPLGDLIRAPLNAIRLGPSLVDALVKDLKVSAVVDGLAATAHALGLTVFARMGSEAGALEWLADVGVDYFEDLRSGAATRMSLSMERCGVILESGSGASSGWPPVQDIGDTSRTADVLRYLRA